METVITCKHLPNNKPMLYYGLFINCLSEFPVLLPCLYYFFFFFFFSGIEVSFKTCGLSIMRKKNYMQNPLLHIQIYLLLHMKRDWGNSNRNETSLIWTKKILEQRTFHFEMDVCKTTFLDFCKNIFISLEYWWPDELRIRSISPVYIPPFI